MEAAGKPKIMDFVLMEYLAINQVFTTAAAAPTVCCFQYFPLHQYSNSRMKNIREQGYGIDFLSSRIKIWGRRSRSSNRN